MVAVKCSIVRRINRYRPHFGAPLQGDALTGVRWVAEATRQAHHGLKNAAAWNGNFLCDDHHATNRHNKKQVAASHVTLDHLHKIDSQTRRHTHDSAKIDGNSGGL